MSKNRKGISHEEVHRALNKFKEGGGLITQLPDQVAPRRNQVGGKWAVYETMSDVSSADSAGS